MMSSRRTTIIKPLDACNASSVFFYHVEWNLFKTVIDFEFGSLKILLSLFDKIVQNPVRI